MMKILITGASGFIGSHLVQRLSEQGHSLTCVIRNRSNIEFLRQFKVKFLQLDNLMSGKIILSDVDTVYHLAGIRHKWGTSWQDYRESGYNYTKRLLELSKGKAGHFVFFSSVAAYDYPRCLPINETTPKNPHNLYGKSKLQCEEVIREYNRMYGIPFTIIQPSIVYGERDMTGMLTRLIRMIHQGKYLTVGKGVNRLQMIYIRDLIDFSIKAGTENLPTNDDYIVSYKSPISVNKLVELIKAKLRLKQKRVNIKIPEWFARASASVLETCYKLGIPLTGREPIIAQEKIDTMVKDVWYDISKASKVFDFSPQVDYIDGIARVVGDMRLRGEI
jgi:nucleoside-diphosphate-sugar epimerase